MDFLPIKFLIIPDRVHLQGDKTLPAGIIHQVGKTDPVDVCAYGVSHGLHADLVPLPAQVHPCYIHVIGHGI